MTGGTRGVRLARVRRAYDAHMRGGWGAHGEPAMHTLDACNSGGSLLLRSHWNGAHVSGDINTHEHTPSAQRRAHLLRSAISLWVLSPTRTLLPSSGLLRSCAAPLFSSACIAPMTCSRTVLRRTTMLASTAGTPQWCGITSPARQLWISPLSSDTGRADWQAGRCGTCRFGGKGQVGANVIRQLRFSLCLQVLADELGRVLGVVAARRSRLCHGG